MKENKTLFNNLTDNELVNQFDLKYAEILFNKCETLKKFVIDVMSMEQYCEIKETLQNESIPIIVDADKELMCCFIDGKSDASLTKAGIVLNETLIRKLKISDNEFFSSIAHEIGHIMYYFLENKELHFEGEECYSDGIADKIGIRESMISVLQKLIDSGFYSKEICNSLNFRIMYLKAFPNN